ncbi:MAG: septation protein SpoVG family protein [Candidatus Omnitrophica bacterium]|nr:septation protein SpoVG family protein [Candidatus Omnitrophota bacterium]
MLDIEIARMYRLEGDGATKAFCDIIVSDSLLIKGIRIMEGKNGLFVKMPAKQGKDGKWYNSIEPTPKETQEALNDAIIKAFND